MSVFLYVIKFNVNLHKRLSVLINCEVQLFKFEFIDHKYTYAPLFLLLKWQLAPRAYFY